MGDVIPSPTDHGTLLRNEATNLLADVISFEQKTIRAIKDAEELLGDVALRHVFSDDPQPPEPVA